MLAKRLVSGLALAALGISGTILGGWAFDLLVLVAALLMAYEYGRIVARLRGDAGFNWTAVVAAMTATVLGGYGLLHAGPGDALATVLLVALAAVAIRALIGRSDGNRAGFGVIYIALPCLVMVDLRLIEPQGLSVVLWMFAVVWTTDTAAYLVGRSFGGPKVAPAISPGKTWSGCIGGAIGGTAAGVAVASLTNGRADAAAIAALIVSISGQAGDLFESRLKRTAGLKDSGSVIPGHGGVLDRLDAVLFAAPVTSAICYLAGPGTLT